MTNEVNDMEAREDEEGNPTIDLSLKRFIFFREAGTRESVL